MKKIIQHLFSVIVFAGFLFMAFGSDDDTKPTDSTNTTTETASEDAMPDVEILKQTASYEDTIDAYTIHCRVKNNSGELITYLDLKATFYDKQGNIVGTGMGNAANFAAGAEKTIDVLGLDIHNCDKYEVQVDNVMK